MAIFFTKTDFLYHTNLKFLLNNFKIFLKFASFLILQNSTPLGQEFSAKQ